MPEEGLEYAKNVDRGVLTVLTILCNKIHLKVQTLRNILPVPKRSGFNQRKKEKERDGGERGWGERKIVFDSCMLFLSKLINSALGSMWSELHFYITACG